MSRSSSPFLATSKTRSVQDSSAFRLLTGRLTAFAFPFSFFCVALRPLPIAALRVCLPLVVLPPLLPLAGLIFVLPLATLSSFLPLTELPPFRRSLVCLLFCRSLRCLLFCRSLLCILCGPLLLGRLSFSVLVWLLHPNLYPLSLTTLGVNIEYFMLTENVF